MTSPSQPATGLGPSPSGTPPPNPAAAAPSPAPSSAPAAAQVRGSSTATGTYQPPAQGATIDQGAAQRAIRRQARRDRGGGSPVIPLILLGTGAYLAWFAVHYWRGQGDLVWPSTPIKSVLQGKGLPSSDAAQPAAATVTAFESELSGNQAPGSGGPAPAPSGKAQHAARLLLPRYGWGTDQIGPLIMLWTRESGWQASIRNPSSGAFGIAQALGHGTQDTAAETSYTYPGGGGGSGEVNEYGPEYGLTPGAARQANAGNYLEQIRWGLGYIKAEYQDPAGAWAHEQEHGWY